LVRARKWRADLEADRRGDGALLVVEGGLLLKVDDVGSA